MNNAIECPKNFCNQPFGHRGPCAYSNLKPKDTYDYMKDSPLMQDNPKDTTIKEFIKEEQKMKYSQMHESILASHKKQFDISIKKSADYSRGEDPYRNF